MSVAGLARALVAMGLVALLAGCGSGGSVNPTPTPATASDLPSDQSDPFPTGAFADIREAPGL